MNGANPISGKNLVLEIWAKMFLANQIAGFLKQQYLENETVNELDFLHVDTHLGMELVDGNFFLKIMPKNVLSQSDCRILETAIF